MHMSRMVALATALTVGIAAPALAQDKLVRVWHTETEPQTIKAFNDLARRFEAKNPGIKIEAEGLAWTDLEGKIMASLAAGSPPELSHGQPITCTALQSKDLLNPLDEVVKAIGEDNIWEQVKRVCNVGGKQFGLVHAAGTSLLIYRKDMADKAGLKPPKTWNDFLANAKALTQSTKGDGKIDIYGITLPGDNLFINILMGELIKSNGGALFDKNNKPLFTDQKMIEVLEFWRELVKYAPPGWEGDGYLQTFQNLYGQKAAMMFQGYGRGAGLIEKFAPKEKANDKTFLKFFYQDDNYLEYVSTVPIHLFPITKSLRASPKYQNLEMIQRWKGWIEVQQGYLDKDQGKPTLVVDWSDMTEKPYLLEVLGSGIVRDMVMDVVLEKWGPKRAADKAQRRLEDLLRSKGYLKG